MSEEIKAKKLTEAELPGLKDWGGGTVCRYYSGTTEIACTTQYATEDQCARNAPTGSGIGYSWTGKACGS